MVYNTFVITLSCHFSKSFFRRSQSVRESSAVSSNHIPVAADFVRVIV